MQKRLMEAVGLSAVLFDIDEAGYLGAQEAAAAQKARVDIGAFCERLAAEYLNRHPEPVLAKQQLRADIKAIEVATDTGQFTDEEPVLFGRFASLLDQRIDRLASKSAWQRKFILWFFRTPTIIKLIISVAAFTGIAIAVGDLVGR